MKHLLILAASAMIFIASCKKQNVEPESGITKQPSMAEQVADLIKKGDPEMYDLIYNSNNKAAKPKSHTHPGVFHWPATQGPESGYCIAWPNCVCMVCIEGARLVDENTPQDEITSNFSASWTEPGDAELLINDGRSTKIENLQSLDVIFDENGNSSITYTTL